MLGSSHGKQVIHAGVDCNLGMLLVVHTVRPQINSTLCAVAHLHLGVQRGQVGVRAD